MTTLGKIASLIDRLNGAVGWAVAWTAVALVLIQFIIVVQRYVFGVGSILMQESLIYLFATLFMLGAGYTLLHNGHVRVDIFYRSAPARRKAWVDFLGVVFLLIPVCVTIWLTGFPYVDAAWAVREGSREASGIQGVYLLKTEILIFSVLVVLQGLSLAIHSLRVLQGREAPSSEDPLAL